ncbi:MAG: globin [Candidatus Competibacterales bacterium]
MNAPIPPTVSPEQLKAVRASLQRCLAQPQFIGRFYENFMASSQEIRDKFQGVDLKRQQVMLKASLHIVLLLSQGGSLGDQSAVTHLIELHDRHHRDIRPGLYGLWLDAMVKTIAEFDDQYSAELDDNWRLALAPGIALFQARY